AARGDYQPGSRTVGENQPRHGGAGISRRRSDGTAAAPRMMDRKIIELDTAYFWADVFDWQIDWRGSAGQSGITGAGQVIYGNQPRWIGRPNFKTFRKDRIRSWRAVIAQGRGRYNVFRVKM